MSLVLSTPTSRLFIAGDVTDHSVWIQPWAGGSCINLEILFNFEHEPKDFNHFRPGKNSCFCHTTSFANKTTGINCGRQRFLVSTKQFCKWPDFPQFLPKKPPNLMRTTPAITHLLYTCRGETKFKVAHPYSISSNHPLWARKRYVLMKAPMTLTALHHMQLHYSSTCMSQTA